MDYSTHVARHTKQQMQSFLQNLQSPPTCRCIKCFKFDTSDLRDLLTHLETHGFRQPYMECPLCPFMRCCGGRSFLEHAREAHPLVITEMQRGCMGFSILNEHLMFVRLRPIGDLQHLVSAVSSVEVVTNFSCVACVKETAALDSASAVLQHHRAQHPSTDIRYVCDLCHKKGSILFDTLPELHSHVWAVHGHDGAVLSKIDSFQVTFLE